MGKMKLAAVITMRQPLCLAIAFALLWQPGFCQTDPWVLVRSVEKGKEVYIDLSSGKTVKARMDEWQPERLVVRKGKNETITVEQGDIIRIRLVTGRRGRRALWGGTIGGVAGGAIGVGAGADDSISKLPGTIVGSALCFGGIGALIGYATPHKVEIYKIPRVKKEIKEK